MNKNYICNVCETNQSKIIDYFPNQIFRYIKFFIYFFKINFFIKILFRNLYLAKFPDGEELFLNKKIILCSNCKLGTTYPMIDEKTLNNYYRKNYWLNHRNIKSNVISDNEKLNFKKKIDFIKDKIDKKMDYVFGEFGCGKGTLASIAIENISVKKYFGIELSTVSLTNDLLKNNKFSQVESIEQIKDDSIDIFIMIQSIEHLVDVNSFFKRLNYKLKKNSLLLIETPNYNEYYFKNKKSGWVPHTLFFNKSSLLYLSEKFKFEVVDFQFMDGTWAELGLNSKDVENEDHNMRILLRKN